MEKETIELVKKMIEDGNLSEEIAEKYCPELKESEDERIRKALLLYIRNRNDAVVKEDIGIDRKDAISWLEKQGEQINLPHFTFDDVLALQCCMETVKKVQEDNELYEQLKSLHDRLYDTYQLVEKQGEQKPTDKVEPKFKAGNWYQCTKDFFGKGVTFDKNTAYYCEKDGCLQNEYGCHIAIVKDLYDNFKLWDISDAKDGDVLVKDVYPSGLSICIFKEFIRQTFTMKVHCSINNEGQLHNQDVYYHRYDVTLYPATKEQRALLFKKMHEAGYEWDAEKKELKKIEQKPVDKVDQPCTEEVYKQNLAWSKEDEINLNYITRIIEKLYDKQEKNYLKESLEGKINWLRLLKERVQPQPKQEWSKDDEYYRNIILYILNNECVGKTDKENAINWLKSLRPHWKPSEEQMKVLRYLDKGTSLNDFDKRVLRVLIDQLKKLKEE